MIPKDEMNPGLTQSDPNSKDCRAKKISGVQRHRLALKTRRVMDGPGLAAGVTTRPAYAASLDPGAIGSTVSLKTAPFQHQGLGRGRLI
jgi:hypothetical protein